MRTSEVLQIILGLLTQIIPHLSVNKCSWAADKANTIKDCQMFVWTLIFQAAAVITWVLGGFMQGLRFVQLVHFLGFVIQFVYCGVWYLGLRDAFSPIATIIYCVFLVAYLILVMVYGCGDFARLKLNGPYRVGVRKFRSFKLNYGEKSGKDAQILMFYPTDAHIYERRENDGYKTWNNWIFDKNVIGDACAAQSAGTDMPSCFWRPQHGI